MSPSTNGISGLGIDMGTPLSDDHYQRRTTASNASSSQRDAHASRPRSMQLPESLNQYNDHRRASQLPVRRPTTSSERKVRIVSGQPGVMESEKSEARSGGDGGGPRGHTAKRYTSGPMNRNSRLGAAVAAMGQQHGHSAWESESSGTPSDFYQSDSSPQTDSSATTYSSVSGYGSGGSNSLKRTHTVRKQVSQPNLSRTSTLMVRGATSDGRTSAPQAQRGNTMGPPSPDNARKVLRSKSTLSLASQYRSEEGGSGVRGNASLSRSGVGSTSLGRTAEIPRSGSRGGSAMRGRGGDPYRGGAGRRATWDPRSSHAQHSNDEDGAAGEGRGPSEKRRQPDGFGGFIEIDDNKSLDESEARNDEQMASQPSQQPISREQQERQHQSRHQQPETQQQPYADTIAQRPHMRPRSLTVDSRPATSLRVGSFYGPGGEECARIDAQGNLSQAGLDSHRGSISYESSNGHSDAPTTSSYHSTSSQNSAGPRLQFMASPARAAQMQQSRSGTSVASASTGVSTSLADGNVHVLMRSASGFRGLRGAERGEAMVSLDNLRTGFDEGEAILPGKTRTVDDESILQSARLSQQRDSIDHSSSAQPFTRPHGHLRQASAPAGVLPVNGKASVALERHGTLIAAQSNPARRSKDLSRLLANNNGKLPSSSSSTATSEAGASSASGAISSNGQGKNVSNAPVGVPQAILEHGKSGKSRVDVDLVLESELVVEGGVLAGRLEVKVRKNSTKDGHLMLGQPKVRVVGFEELVNDDTRHIFYHFATVIDGRPKIGNAPARPYVLHGSPNLSSPESDNRQPLACFASGPDAEGYCVAKEGQHSIPFALDLPVGKGAKGSYRGKHSVVRYIVIGSVKLKSANGRNHSIAHFYRHIDLYPYLNPAIVLSSSQKPIIARASKGLFLGGSGKVHLQASLHRSTWIAGQRLYVHMRIDNQTNKKVKSLSLALVRTVVLYRPRPEFDMNLAAPDDPTETYIDPDACTTSTSRKKICEDVLEMGQKGSKGTVTARGWWTGVEAGDSVEFSHNMKLPVDALTITRGRHVEVVYSLKVSVGSSLSSDVSVELPVRIVNFVSLDPPPLKSGIKAISGSVPMEGRNAISDSEAPMIARVRSMEALRSPQGQSRGFQQQSMPPDGRYLNVARHVDSVRPSSRQSTEQRNAAGLRKDLDERNDSDDAASRQRKLQHQKSLDFINHAIRSATARRGASGSSTEQSPAGLGIEVDEGRTPLADRDCASSISSSSSGGSATTQSASEAVHPSCKPYQHAYPPIVSVSGPVGGPRPLYMPSHAVALDDADDDSDDEYDVGEQTLNLNDDSVADIDLVIESAHVDGGESSPEFQQRRGMESLGGDMTMMSEDDEADLSNVTVTSIEGLTHDGKDQDDEFDEEEERMMRLHSRRYALVVANGDQNDDGGPTPLATSPPKFESEHGARRPVDSLNRRDSITSTSSSSAAASSAAASSCSGASSYTSEALAEAQREGKTIVRTRSDLERRLGRSSTIIRGPSGDRSRPVSPSKQAPSPTKSALKSKSSFTFATDQNPIKQAAHGHGRGTAPLQIRAKVDKRQSASLQARPKSRQHTAMSDNEMSSASSSSGYSDSSASPATSATLSTPRGGMSDIEIMTDEEKYISATASMSGHQGGLGLRVHDVHIDRDAYLSDSLSPKTRHGDVAAMMPKSQTLAHLAADEEQQKRLSSSASTHTLRGSNVVVPSVRDKIAMLESRKQALRELTGHAAEDSPSGTATPPKTNTSGSAAATPSPSRIPRAGGANGVGPKSDPDTPTRVQAAARNFLERNNSVLSQASSITSSLQPQPEYLRNMSSVQSFKAPLFRAK